MTQFSKAEEAFVEEAVVEGRAPYEADQEAIDGASELGEADGYNPVKMREDINAMLVENGHDPAQYTERVDELLSNLTDQPDDLSALIAAILSGEFGEDED